ncbi:hypothetical protein ACTFIW_007381 [Dictyostelium discoideum]
MINHNETVLSFKIPDEYQSKPNVSVKVNVMSNEIQIDISFYVNLSNFNHWVSLNSTNQEVHSYSFLMPSGCGKKEITIKIGTQSSLSLISYIEPIISNSKVSGYDGKSGEIICVGNFGYGNYFNQLYILFSNNKISSSIINRTTLSFPFLSGYQSDNLILEMCEIQSKSFNNNNIKKLLLKVTFDSKSWSGYIFQYSKDEIQNEKAKNSSYDKYYIKKQNKENEINLSRKTKLLIGILIPGCIILFATLIIIFIIIRKHKQQNSNFKNETNS